MKKVIRLTESDLVRLVKKVISDNSSKSLVNEQSKGNQFKEQIADLIDEIQTDMSWDAWRDADNLMDIYKKLLPLKGKKVGKGQIPRYVEMNAEEQNPDLPALHYFNTMYARIPGNKYGMGNSGKGYFTSRIKQVGDNTFFGEVEKTSDGKYTTPQIKSMIINLVNNG